MQFTIGKKYVPYECLIRSDCQGPSGVKKFLSSLMYYIEIVIPEVLHFFSPTNHYYSVLNLKKCTMLYIHNSLCYSKSIYYNDLKQHFPIPFPSMYLFLRPLISEYHAFHIKTTFSPNSPYLHSSRKHIYFISLIIFLSQSDNKSIEITL